MNKFQKTCVATLYILGGLIVLNMTVFTAFTIYTKSNILRNIKMHHNFNPVKFFNKTKFNEIRSDNDLPSVLLFGGGSAKGTDLNLSADNNIEVKLNKILNRTIYNRAVDGGDIQHAVLQVQNGIMDEIVKSSDTAIYIQPRLSDYISLHTFPGPLNDHNFIFNKYQYPVIKNGVLFKTKIPVIKNTVTYRVLNKVFSTLLYTEKLQNINLYNQMNETATEHFILLNNELKKINPNIKLYIFVLFDDAINWIQIINNLKNYDIKIIFADSLIEDHEFKDIEDDWDVVLSKLSEELHINK